MGQLTERDRIDHLGVSNNYFAKHKRTSRLSLRCDLVAAIKKVNVLYTYLVFIVILKTCMTRADPEGDRGQAGACLRAKSKYAGGGYGRGCPPPIR